jgi:hypothetical protein
LPGAAQVVDFHVADSALPALRERNGHSDKGVLVGCSGTLDVQDNVWPRSLIVRCGVRQVISGRFRKVPASSGSSPGVRCNELTEQWHEIVNSYQCERICDASLIP